ncbi:UDP-2,3-diacylglucosamine hydrolase [Planctomycetes bacterium CA13]|uniref:UDP-2,3-diacylglucosamine hydrolase n=1 Tax=Novipirellula herctigrandis TaxID=2527986 RepID=A0A5C5YNN5_9BACT|nr:UDP-2,3-diacylglucosamine hydrolase [Planctomycetes bacterium CA13]
MIYQWPTNSPLGRVLFVSDLHLMSTRSTAEEHEYLIESFIERADLVVWGGDLFDFRWSRLHHESDAVAYSMDYLKSWQTRFPSQRFAFLCGNHDAAPKFLAELKEYAASESNFLFAGDVLRIGDTVMLHGDQIEGRGQIARFELYRQKWADKKRAALWRFAPYDAIVASRAHKVAAAMAHRNKMAVKKLSRFLDLHDLNYANGVRRVVFGHTHRVVKGYELNRMQFFSGGAAIRHVPFHPIEVEF